MSMSAPTSAKLVNKPSFIEALGVRFLIMDAPTDTVLPAYIEVLRKKHVHTVCRACEATYTTSLLEQQGINVVDLHFPDGDAPPSDVITHWVAIVKRTFPDSGAHHATTSASANATASASAGAAGGSGGGGGAGAEGEGGRSPRAGESVPAASAAGVAGAAGGGDGEGDAATAAAAAHHHSSLSGVHSSSGGGSRGGGSKDKSAKTTLAVHCVAGLGRAPVLVAIALIEAGMSAHDAIQLVRAKRRGALNSKQLRFLTKVYRPRRKQTGGSCCTIM